METTLSDLNLKPHNIAAYRKVMDYYGAGNDRAAIVHATGTGKSYIIAAVTRHFSKVMIIAPNNFVLDETRKICGDNITFRTYSSIMCEKSLPGGYDLIVLDEFHRAGAEKWGEGIGRLISANPSAKLLGTSATAIRYLDNERNMADELFDGNVVSHISLRTALDMKILPTPTYVASLYSIDQDIQRRKEMINKKKFKSGSEKEGLMRRLDGIAYNWNNAQGVPYILRKYLRKDIRRIIVFCSKIERIKEIKDSLKSWFAEAGFAKVHFYNINYAESRVEENMEKFQDDNFEGINIALSVNMLNEGVHIPRVDAVIMLRSTISRIIIEQQAGRCLTTDNKGITPVIFDLVNNMDLIRYADNNWTDGNQNLIEDGSEEPGNGLPFKIYDECRDLRMFLTQIDLSITNDDIWYNVYLPMNERFFSMHGHLPGPKENQRAYLFNREQRNKPLQKRYPHRIKWLVEHGFNAEFKEIKSISEKLDMLTEGLERYGSVVVMRKNDPQLMNMWDNMKYTYNHGKKNKKFDFNEEERARFSELLEKYCPDKWEAIFIPIKNILERIGKDGLSKNQRSWIASYLRTGKDPERLERLKGLGVCDFIRKVSPSHDEELKGFLRENSKLPTPSEKGIYATMMRFRRESAQKKNPELFNLLIEYGFSTDRIYKRSKETLEERCERIKRICTEKQTFIGSLPGNDYSWYQRIFKANPDNPAVLEMRSVVEKYKNASMSEISTAELYEERVARIRKIGEQGYIINSKSILFRWWSMRLRNEKMRKRPDHQKIAELEGLTKYMSTHDKKGCQMKLWTSD